ncbi:hypothetical protein [Pseudoclavibacter sp. AY1H1]|uniref:hypothetical protein n=1 Tax=Pseudoclavibacter sp. AY1H1 TaxID=2080584 RepID=UPI000CE71FBC|nr:hypothetical protein [Pseudoclavibacter sp. AY1H1]PPF32655.1 hypothetical protein C5E05_19310 [Pseudoclavibacter sp. AY1H1]
MRQNSNPTGRSVARNSSTGRFVVAHTHISIPQERVSNDGDSTPRQTKTVKREDALAAAKRIAARNKELMRRLA